MKEREKGIGGSDMSSILGLDQYGSPYKVWLAKTGRSEKFEGNKYTLAGHLLEEAVIRYFEIESGHRTIKASSQRFFRHPELDFAMGHIDRNYIAKGMGRGVLEVKTTQKNIDELPASWFAQLQWYLGISDAPFGSVGWLERGLNFYYKEYEFDEEFFQFMIDKAKYFWYENVLKDHAPDPINAEDTEKIYPFHLEGKVINASKSMVESHDRLLELKETIKKAEEEKTKLEDEIKMIMKDCEGVVSSGDLLFTWKKPKASAVFDRDTFQKKHPEMYADFLIQKETSRKFLIK